MSASSFQTPNRDAILWAVRTGRIFSVEFIKRDGSIRRMVCRVGVRKGVTGEGKAFDDADHGLITVFDMQKREYRSFDVSTILSIRVDGITYVYARPVMEVAYAPTQAVVTFGHAEVTIRMTKAGDLKVAKPGAWMLKQLTEETVRSGIRAAQLSA